MLLRRIARPLFASWFLAEGVDALRHPGPHVQAARATLDQLTPVLERAQCELDISDSTLTGLVRAHAAATTCAATLLTLGRLPRLAGATLAGLTVPLAVAEAASIRAARAEHRTTAVRRSPADRTEHRRALLRPLAMVGGALIVAADTAGKPGIGWRVAQARAAREAASPAQ